LGSISYIFFAYKQSCILLSRGKGREGWGEGGGWTIFFKILFQGSQMYYVIGKCLGAISFIYSYNKLDIIYPPPPYNNQWFFWLNLKRAIPAARKIASGGNKCDLSCKKLWLPKIHIYNYAEASLHNFV